MTHRVPLPRIRDYLDSYLRLREIPDERDALNGLQVENRGEISRIVAAVDASQATIDGLRTSGEAGSPLLLVHHGLFWDGNRPMTGRRYRRLRALVDQDAAVYSAHIPLDVHPEIGNNITLARGLELQVAGWFGDYKGILLGVHGCLPGPARTVDQLAEKLARILETPRESIRVICGGPREIGRLGIVTGAGGDMIVSARDAGLDTLITGEGRHHTYFDAQEWGINVIYAGHYATESLGVQSLAAGVSTQFGLPWEFHDHPTGM